MREGRRFGVKDKSKIAKITEGDGWLGMFNRLICVKNGD